MSGPVVFVTGASRGIGAATAARFVRDGATVYLGGRSRETLDAVAAACNDAGPGTAVALDIDVANADSIAAAFRAIFAGSKRLDVLVNCAGTMDDAVTGTITADALAHAFATNATGTILCQQAAARLMQRHRRGSIVNVSSVMASHPAAGKTAYAASKAAVEAATLAGAAELAAWGIRVNAVAPGWIDTALVAGLSADQRAATTARVPMARPGTADEVASVIHFLAGDNASYVTGAIVPVTGGYRP